MRSDPLVALANEFRKLDRAYDCALARRDFATAERLRGLLMANETAQEIAEPTNVRGAAVPLHDAWTVFAQETSSPRGCDIASRLHSIHRRMKRGERRLEDLIELRRLLGIGREYYAMRVPQLANEFPPDKYPRGWADGYREQLAGALRSIEKALRAAAAPQGVSSAR